MKIQVPTLRRIHGVPVVCTVGYHRIEGIGDKHVPWIHNIKNTDMVIAIDDRDCMRLVRLFNEPIGKKYLRNQGISENIVDQLHLLGISSIANVLMAIKFAKYYELTQKDVILTVFTDSMELYGSRVNELRIEHGEYNERDASADFHRSLQGIETDSMAELRYIEKKRIHHLKYFTWIEQQGKKLDELDRQWYDYDTYWDSIRQLTPKIDELIVDFNERVGLY